MIPHIPSPIFLLPAAPQFERWVIPIFFPASIGTLVKIMLGVLVIFMIYWVIKFILTAILGG